MASNWLRGGFSGMLFGISAPSSLGGLILFLSEISDGRDLTVLVMSALWAALGIAGWVVAVFFSVGEHLKILVGYRWVRVHVTIVMSVSCVIPFVVLMPIWTPYIPNAKIIIAIGLGLSAFVILPYVIFAMHLVRKSARDNAARGGQANGLSSPTRTGLR